ncbi:glycoside hydrolase family 25 protein [Microtetraspora niveoalba]|uniref:glycoside hydrolase family 25 protein n=1 Tax=Microtetraspora niveoalba TaxID=46175 RepID=UPI00082A03CE|nr:GH25 family lysozyme [Microtetraspora niveoalba]
MSLSRTLRIASATGLLAAVSATAGLVVSGPAHATPDGPAPIAQAPEEKAAPLIYGEDVSGHEPDHDWNASPARFGFVKATEGVTFTDASFARHWRQLGEKGIVRGAYHFARTYNDPIAEADHFLKVVNSQPSKAGDLLVLDLETSDGNSVSHVNKWAKTWLAYVKKKTGATPMIYTGWNFANTYGGGMSEYPLWVAHYSKAKGAVTPPADWKSWAIHQYTEDPIDENVSALTVDQLRALGRPAAKA